MHAAFELWTEQNCFRLHFFTQLFYCVFELVDHLFHLAEKVFRLVRQVVYPASSDLHFL